MTHIADALKAAGVVVESVEADERLGTVVRVAPAAARDALIALRDSSHAFAFPVDTFGIDTGSAVDVVYHLRSFSHAEEVIVKAAHEYGGELQSVWDIFPAALMPERELAEMFGLTLAGHPNPKHLLLTSAVEPLLLKGVEIRSEEEVRNR